MPRTNTEKQKAPETRPRSRTLFSPPNCKPSHHGRRIMRCFVCPQVTFSPSLASLRGDYHHELAHSLPRRPFAAMLRLNAHISAWNLLPLPRIRSSAGRHEARSTMTGDIASELVAGVDRFLLKQLDESGRKRERYWKRDFSSLRAYDASVEPNRKRLAHILGVRDPLTQFDTAEHPDDFSYQMIANSGESVQCPEHSLASLRRRERRRARSHDAHANADGHDHRHTRRGPDTRTAFWPDAGRAGRISGRPPAWPRTDIT